MKSAPEYPIIRKRIVDESVETGGVAMRSTMTRIIQLTRDRLADPCLIGILSTALLLRVYHLDTQSIWLDEAFSVFFARFDLPQLYFLQENSPPLYFMILHWWIQLFGESEFSVRLPSVVFGAVSVIMMYKIGNRLFNIRVARLSSMLIAISLFHIEFSQEARVYSLEVLLALCSMYYFLNIIEARSLNNYIGYTLSSIFLAYSHIYGPLILIVQNIYFLVLYVTTKSARQLNIRKWILIQSIVVMFFLPWVGVLLNRIRFVEASFWIPKPNIYTLIESFHTYASKSYVLTGIFLLLCVNSLIFLRKRRTHIDGVSSGKGAKIILKKGRRNIDVISSGKGANSESKNDLLKSNRLSLLFLWLLTPIVVPFVISLYSQPIYLTKYTIAASVAFFLLVSNGIDGLTNGRVKALIVMCVVVLTFIKLGGYYTEVNKEQWRDLVKYVDSRFRGDDKLGFLPAFCSVPFYHYSRSDKIPPNSWNPWSENSPRGVKQRHDAGRGSGFAARPPMTFDLLAEKGSTDFVVDKGDVNKFSEPYRQGGRIWFIFREEGDPRGNSNKAILSRFIDESAVVVHRDYYNVKLYLFLR